MPEGGRGVWRTAWRRTHGEHGVVEVASAPGSEHRVTTINTCTRCCAGAKDVEFEKCYSARLSLNDMEGNASPRGCHVCASAPRLLRACTRLSDFVWPAPKHTELPPRFLSFFLSVHRLSVYRRDFSSGNRTVRARHRRPEHPRARTTPCTSFWYFGRFRTGKPDRTIEYRSRNF